MHKKIITRLNQTILTDETRPFFCNLLWYTGKYRQAQIAEKVGWTKEQVREAIDLDFPPLKEVAL